MPPKAKITKEMILRTVLAITRETGFKTVSARSIASRLQCSTRPIFTCYANMEELKQDFLHFAFAFYHQYVSDYGKAKNIEPCLLLPLSYLAFAKEETHLFQLLFIDDMDLHMTEAKDFYQEIGNEKKANTFAHMIGVDFEKAKEIFLDLFLYTHGIAVLTVTGKWALTEDSQEKMIRNLLFALTTSKK